MTKLHIKKLNADAKLPEKAHKTDAGFELFFQLRAKKYYQVIQN